MTEITADQIKEFRSHTGLGILEARNALKATEGNFNLALEYVRKRTGEIVESRRAVSASAGIVDSYIHTGNCIGVLIEVNCEKHTTTTNEIFKSLVKDLALQIAAASPVYVSRSDIPKEVLSKEVEIARAAAPQGCDELGRKKFIEGKLSTFYQTYILLDQPFIKKPEYTIQQLIEEKIVQLKENICIKRFVRFQLGTNS